MSPRRATGVAIVITLMSSATGCSSSSGTAASTPGTLRLLAPTTAVVATRESASTPVVVDAEASVSSPDRDFVVRVTRAAGQATTVASVLDPLAPTSVATGTPASTNPAASSGTNASSADTRRLRALPAGIVDFTGVRTFGRYIVTGPTGAEVLQDDVQWCPGNTRTHLGGGRASLVYPDSCNTSPFATGTVWGIEQGWASALPIAFGLDGPDGTYHVAVTVAPTVVAAFGFAPDATTVAFDVSLRTDPDTPSSSSPSTDGTSPGPLVTATTSTISPEASVDHSAPDPSLEAVAPPPDVLPDIRPLPAFGISATVENSTDLLNFNASVWNVGAPFVVEGYRRGVAATMDAVQLFYRGSTLVAAQPVGTFEYHAGGGHNHWHFLDFVRYDLVDTAGKVVATSGKQAWCLANTTAVDLLIGEANLRPGSTALNSACGDASARFLRESLATGWGDTYSQSVTGQALDITAVPNGHYGLVITTNPVGRFHEAAAAPKTSSRGLDLGGTAGSRTVVVAPFDGISV